MKHFILENKEIKECDLMTWAKWFEGSERIIDNDKINEVTVSTIFLGIDHGYMNNKPLLFETMVFGGKLDEEQYRYYTYDEAQKGHKETLKKVMKSLTKEQPCKG